MEAETPSPDRQRPRPTMSLPGLGPRCACAAPGCFYVVVAGAVGIGLAASKFPAGYFPYCASPAGGASAWCWRPMIFHGVIVQRENSAFARRQRGFESHWLYHFRDATKLVCGGMAERLIAAVLKTAGGSRLPGVQIPLPPPPRHKIISKRRTNERRKNQHRGQG